jgi:uncharacterized cupin superfamily protein
MQRRTVIAFGLGVGGAASASVCMDLARMLPGPALAYTQPQEMRLAPFQVNPAWVKEGTPNFRALEYGRSPDGRVTSGLFACDGPSRFDWVYAHDETIHLLEGEVHIGYLGREFTLRPGSTTTFAAETTAHWYVPLHVKKVFKLIEPGRAVRWSRRAVRALGSSV